MLSNEKKCPKCHSWLEEIEKNVGFDAINGVSFTVIIALVCSNRHCDYIYVEQIPE